MILHKIMLRIFYIFLQIFHKAFFPVIIFISPIVYIFTGSAHKFVAWYFDNLDDLLSEFSNNIEEL